MKRQRAAALLVGALAWLVAAAGAAQQGTGGALSGTVTDARSGAPVNAAQVNVLGTSLNALTGTDGRFLIANVPAGTVTVVVHRIGYGLGEQSNVTVTSGQTTTVNIQLRERALALDEIVVTGTAGGTQKRAIGNVVAQVNAEQVIARSPIVKVDELLAQRTAGVIMLPGTGQVGTGSAIRIRGSGSITQGNEPIVYIDGIRMDSDAGRGPGQRGGANVSRLNDIHPADIASIEIIKGPAAATLYGTEASNGVVQIITKRGTSGAPQFEATARVGTNWLWKPGERTGLRYMPDANDPTKLIGLNVYEHEIQNGGEPIFGYGLLQSYNVSMRGGTDAVRYFASVSRDNDRGIVDWNWDHRVSLRGNVEAALTNKVRVTLATSYINGQTRLAQGSIDTDPFSNLIWSNPRNLNTPSRGWRNAPPEEWSKVHSRADNDRTTASIELRYQPASWLTNRLITGLDLNSENNWTLTPLLPEGASHFYGTQALGDKSVARGTRRFITVDYASTGNFNWREFSLAPSVGFQFYKTESSFITATGAQFPAIPITTITGGATRSGTETFSENATVGVYVQQQVGWKNRAFVTAAVRGDDNSAFGAEFDAAIYPKLSATWVISEEPFWSFGLADELRLRAAWGAAGRQPGTFDAARTFSPVIGYQNQPALTMGQYGNPQLKPERGEELELGFDASLFGGRIGVEYTHFRKRVKDAIINSPLPPSSGFTGSQIVNIGLIHTGGNELGLNAGLVSSGGFAWNIDTQLATFTNTIKSLGPDLKVIFGGTQSQHRVGYSIADLFMKRVLTARINALGQAEGECDGGTGPDGLQPGGTPVPCASAPQLFLGHSQPRWQIGVGNTFTFFNNLSLYARVEGNGGHKQVNTEIRATHNQATTEAVLLNEPILQAYRRYENDRTGVYEAGFLRLREISANYSLPQVMAQRLFAKRAQVSVGMRNVMMLWTAQHGWNTYRDGRVVEPLANMITWDPEVRGTGDNSVGYQTVLPPTASATMTLRLSF